MKRSRQHPDNPELFWCPKCEMYKERGEFASSKNYFPHCIASQCKSCMKKKRNKSGNTHIASRQNGINNDLFWCPQCKNYRSRNSFYTANGRKYGISSFCKEHTSAKIAARMTNRKELNPTKLKNDRKKNKERFFSTNENVIVYRDKNRKRAKRNYIQNPDKYREITRMRTANLDSCYVKVKLKQRGLVITPETIELKRQQIIMKRTLKQFKKWREENESSSSDVSGKQQENESDNEGRL